MDRPSASSLSPQWCKAVASVRAELAAQNRGDVLARARQPNDVHMIATLEAAPQQRRLRHPPSPQRRNAKRLAKRRHAHAGLQLDLIKCLVGGLRHHQRQARATLVAAVPDLALLIAQRLRAQNGRLPSISPRAIASSSLSSALARRRPGPDARPSWIRSRSRF